MITEELLLSLISEIEIFDYYLSKYYESIGIYYEGFSLNHKYYSPIREVKENTPDFRVFLSKWNTLFFKDHGTGLSGSVFMFVGLIYKIDYRNSGIVDKIKVLSQIDEDLGLGIMCLAPSLSQRLSQKTISQITYQANSKSVIQIWKSTFSTSDKDTGVTPIGMEWWKSYGIIKKETLIKYQVFGISQFSIQKGDGKLITKSYKENDLVFAYNIANKFKIMFLLQNNVRIDKSKKWINNYEYHYCEGFLQIDWEVLAKNKILIITKAMKECMFFYEQRLSAIAGKSESSLIDERYFTYIKNKVPDVKFVVFLDNDKQGIAETQKYKELLEKLNLSYQILQIELSYFVKDITDFVKVIGYSQAIEWLSKKLNL